MSLNIIKATFWMKCWFLNQSDIVVAYVTFDIASNIDLACDYLHTYIKCLKISSPNEGEFVLPAKDSRIYNGTHKF